MLKSRMGTQSHVGSKMQNQESREREKQHVDIYFYACAVEEHTNERTNTITNIK